jgi:hypothetical protein
MDIEGKFKVDNYDFLKCYDFPPHHVCISNPPWSVKYIVLEKLLLLGNPFILLLPLFCISTVRFNELIKLHNVYFELGIITPTPAFIYEGKKIQVSACAWFIWRANNNPGPGRIIYLNSTDDVNFGEVVLVN